MAGTAARAPPASSVLCTERPQGRSLATGLRAYVPADALRSHSIAHALNEWAIAVRLDCRTGVRSKMSKQVTQRRPAPGRRRSGMAKTPRYPAAVMAHLSMQTPVAKMLAALQRTPHSVMMTALQQSPQVK